MKLFQLFISLTVFGNVAAYDLIFNTNKDVSLWKFNGSYIYSQSMQNVGSLIPAHLLRSSRQEEIQRRGVWLTRYSGPDAENFFHLHYSLKHHLFSQGWVRFIASPSVPLVITTNHNREVGRFWSDGKNWCDAVVSINLLQSVGLELRTENPGEYALIDKVVMGVLANITQLTDNTTLNTCLISPSESPLEDVNGMAPDMIEKPPHTSHHRSESPPDMIPKPMHSQHGQRPVTGSTNQQMPRMSNDGLTPRLNLSTVTSNQPEISTEPDDSSEVKCGCSCSCSRIKGKNANGAASG